MTTPTAREVRDHLATLLREVRSMQGPDGWVAAVGRAYRSGDVVAGEEGMRRVEDLFRMLEVLIETVQWPEVDEA